MVEHYVLWVSGMVRYAKDLADVLKLCRVTYIDPSTNSWKECDSIQCRGNQQSQYESDPFAALDDRAIWGGTVLLGGSGRSHGGLEWTN